MAPSLVTTANRPGVPTEARTYSHISIVPVPPTNPSVYFLTLAGQVGTPPPTASGLPPAPIPTSLAEQAANVFANATACLALRGATPRDVTKITTYVVGYDPSMTDVLLDAITAFFYVDDKTEIHKPPSTLLGVAALASPEFLIEVDITAVIAAR